MKLTFDGRGINGDDEYGSRLATLTEAGHALNIGPILAGVIPKRDMEREIVAFAKSFGDSFGNLSNNEEAVRAAITSFEGMSDYTSDEVQIVDAWCLWNEARKEFLS